MFKKRVLRNIFGPYKVQIIRNRGEFHSEGCPVTKYYLGYKIK
jgi:hypothetical protein